MTGYDKLLTRLRIEGNFRAIPAEDSEPVTDFSTNDYLGLAARRDLHEAFMADKLRSGALLTSSASRLLASDQASYKRLEDYLKTLYGKEALVLNSGYHANTGLIPALAADAKTVIVADKLVHASIIDGAVLSKAPLRRFRHNDMAHLRRVLDSVIGEYERIIIVVESVYSMDGDEAPLQELIAIKRNVPEAVLYVDEAHALGVCGPQGLGLCAELSDTDRREVDVIIGTLGKACASSGAFAIMSGELRDVAVNRARSFIFSTALPPLCCEWSLWMLECMTHMDGERAHLRHLSELLYSGLKSIGGVRAGCASHIQPVIIGDAAKAVALSRRLLARGIKVLPIRTPTVPPGTERLRISLSAAMTDADVYNLLNAIRAEYEV
ncbi:MAG: 8-amino-7-oxononanoate synthase [Muribaculaceae bacterium]|nr:8-amino-7-oxononanoate synthase [Muribaculaceae bacterium]